MWQTNYQYFITYYGKMSHLIKQTHAKKHSKRLRILDLLHNLSNYPELPINIYTDASDKGMGAILKQI